MYLWTLEMLEFYDWPRPQTLTCLGTLRTLDLERNVYVAELDPLENKKNMFIVLLFEKHKYQFSDTECALN